MIGSTMYNLHIQKNQNNCHKIISLTNLVLKIKIIKANGLSLHVVITSTVGTQRAYFELKYFEIVKIRDAKYSLKMAAEKWRQIFPFLNALYS